MFFTKGVVDSQLFKYLHVSHDTLLDVYFKTVTDIFLLLLVKVTK